MNNFKNSHLIIPISIVFHLCLINGILYLLTPETYLKWNHILYYNISWLVITFSLNFYPTERRDRFMTKIYKLIQLYLVYGLAYFALFGFTNTKLESLSYQLLVFGLICLALLCYRIIFFWARRRYRMGGGNFVNVVVIGRDKNLKKIRKVFDTPDLGYRYLGFFEDTPSRSSTYLGKIEDCFLYLLENSIDEIYCVASKVNHLQLINLINFADNNLIKLKVILDNKEIFSRAMSLESYENVPVLNLRKVPLDAEYARIIKRSFDVAVSTLVIVLVLSWLTPLLYILFQIDSPGPVFFKQKRHGLKRKEFWCYKYRSMFNNGDADFKMTTKNDIRVTRIGKILRRTNIDELPQFLNVFLGEMSVVGPRPHMEVHTEDYEISVDKYLVRHLVKPGITGLAQIMGYRGEIVKKSDIINRTRLDIFYVEKWTLGLDLNIVYKTALNVIQGEERAY